MSINRTRTSMLSICVATLVVAASHGAAQTLTAEMISPTDTLHENGGAVPLYRDGVIGILAWGGYDCNGGRSAAAEWYNPYSDTWTQLDPLPEGGRAGMAEFALGYWAYSVGGEGPSGGQFNSGVMRGTPWETRSPYPRNMINGLSAVVDGVAYVGGGRTGYGATNDTWYAYDEASNQWSQRPDMPLAVTETVAVSWGGKVYVFGGNHKPDEPTNERVRHIQTFNPATDQWTLISDAMPALLDKPSGVVYQDEMFIFSNSVWDDSLGGFVRNDDVFVYSFTTEQWRILPLVLPEGVRAWYRTPVVQIDGYAYIIGTYHTDNSCSLDVLRVNLRPCGKADYNGDGSVNTLDVIAFLDDWVNCRN